MGVAQKALELGVEYVSQREQFGKKIGTYQAVSHPLADTYVETELARSLAYWAAWCVAEDDEQAPVAAAAAKAQCAETAVAACERSIQVHGGIGFTWEHPLHRYYKRAQWIDAFGGHAATQRAAVAAALLDPVRRLRRRMPVPKAEVLELMRMEVDPAEVDEIRELWKEHSKAEDNRSIEGLLATLTEDCVYTVYPDDVSWHGHEGAARFYTELLTAFPTSSSSSRTSSSVRRASSRRPSSPAPTRRSGSTTSRRESG